VASVPESFEVVRLEVPSGGKHATAYLELRSLKDNRVMSANLPYRDFCKLQFGKFQNGPIDWQPPSEGLVFEFLYYNPWMHTDHSVEQVFVHFNRTSRRLTRQKTGQLYL